MNRKERRKYLRAYQKKLSAFGFKREQTKEFAKFKLAKIESETLLEGDKVILDYETISKYPDYQNRVSGFKETVEKLKGKVCTVIYDDKHKTGDPYFVCLEEDDHEPKWLFARTDLIKQENKNEEKETKETN